MPTKRQRNIDTITTRYHNAEDDRARGQIRKEARAAGVTLPSLDTTHTTQPEAKIGVPEDPFRVLAAIAMSEHDTPVSTLNLSRSYWAGMEPVRNLQEKLRAEKTADRLHAVLSGIAVAQAQISEQALGGAWQRWQTRPSGSTLTPIINRFFLPIAPQPSTPEPIPTALTATDEEPLIRIGESIFEGQYEGVAAIHQRGPNLPREKLIHNLSLSVVRYDYFQASGFGDLADEDSMEVFEEMYLSPAIDGDQAARQSIQPVASVIVASKALSPGSQV